MTTRPTPADPHHGSPHHGSPLHSSTTHHGSTHHDGLRRTGLPRRTDSHHAGLRRADPHGTDPLRGTRGDRPAAPPARPHHPHASARAGQHPPTGRQPRHPRAACAPAAPAAPAPDFRTGLSMRFAQQLVEVLTGARPSGQLMRHTTLDGYGQLASLVRTGTLRRGGAADRPRLGPVHDRSPSPDAIEACVRVDLGSRHHMVAFRLELRGPAGQWQCTAVEAR
ncbi:Rv3235 family protein [Kitasatospora sp. NBC_01560]|uniref:Rv3235 family protein n=1 Tax=Kitasatospora sp. NBC_01560 TaxID=2975965 RepID=UPI00386D9BD1